MTKAEIVAAIADQAGLSREQAKNALDAFTTVIARAMKTGQEVRLVGFGSFVPVNRPAGPARNPRTGQVVHRAAATSCRFRAGDSLKASLNGHS